MLLEGVNQNLVLLLVAQDLPENLVDVMHGVIFFLAEVKFIHLTVK